MVPMLGAVQSLRSDSGLVAEDGGQPVGRAVDGGRDAIARLGDFRLDLRDGFWRRGRIAIGPCRLVVRLRLQPFNGLLDAFAGLAQSDADTPRFAKEPTR